MNAHIVARTALVLIQQELSAIIRVTIAAVTQQGHHAATIAARNVKRSAPMNTAGIAVSRRNRHAYIAMTAHAVLRCK